MYALSPSHCPTGESCAARTRKAQRRPIAQTLTLILDGVTSDDYLQWVRDPDPPDRGGPKLISVQSAPLSDRIRLEVISDGVVPAAGVAAHAVGFPITADVAAVQAASEHPAAQSKPRPT